MFQNPIPSTGSCETGGGVSGGVGNAGLTSGDGDDVVDADESCAASDFTRSSLSYGVELSFFLESNVAFHTEVVFFFLITATPKGKTSLFV